MRLPFVPAGRGRGGDAVLLARPPRARTTVRTSSPNGTVAVHRVFGSLAAGAMFSQRAGRSRAKPAHDAAARERAVLTANRRGLTVAEVMAGALQPRGRTPPARRAVRQGPGRTGSIVEQDPFPWTEDDIRRADHDAARDRGPLGGGRPTTRTMDDFWPTC